MLRLLTNADKEKALEYISRNTMETTFLYANVIEFGLENDKEIRRCADYYGYFEGENLLGIMPFYNLGSCIPHYESNEAVGYFLEVMRKRNFGYLMGMKKIIDPIYEGLKEYKTVEEYDESSYFICYDLEPYFVEGIEFKDAKTGEDSVIDFLKFASEDGFKNPRTREDIIKTLRQSSPEEEYVLAYRGDKIVASANIQTYTDRVNQIGGVYTPGEERGKGYCKAMITEISTRIIKRGKTPTLFVIKKNTPAVKAYEAVGFEHYDDYLYIKFAK